MVGNLDGPRHVLLTGGLIGKDGGQEIVTADSVDCGWHPLAAALSEEGQGARCVPAPADAEDRGVQDGLLQSVLHAFRGEEIKDRLEGKTVLGSQRKQDPVVGRRRLELEVETGAEFFSQGKTKGPVQ